MGIIQKINVPSKSSDYKETIVQCNLGLSSKMGVLNEKMCKTYQKKISLLQTKMRFTKNT